MTFKDLIDQVVRTSGEQGDSDYREDVRRWLNFTRAQIADRAFWRTAVRSGINTTLSSRANGVWGIGILYDHVLGDTIWDETNNSPVRHESAQAIGSHDPDQSVTGPPVVWSDAGVSSTGERQVTFWPRPTVSTTIRFNAYLKLTDIDVSQESLSIDPFFGSISQWSACLIAGMRYWMEVDDGETADEPPSLGAFEVILKRRIARNGVNPMSSVRAVPVKASRLSSYGRLDPAHYNNG